MYFLGYLIAFFFLVVCSSVLVSPFSLASALAIRWVVPRQFGSLVVYPMTHFVIEATGNVVAVWLATLLMHKIGVKPVFMMFVVPAVALYWNAKDRLASAVGEMLQETGQESIAHLTNVRAKWAELWADMVGPVIGMALFLKGSSFV